MGQLIVWKFSSLSSQLAGKRQGRFSAPGAKRSIMVVDETNAGAPLFLDPYLRIDSPGGKSCEKGNEESACHSCLMIF